MQDGRRRLVGVVDDDAAVRDSLRFLLEAANFMVVTFHSAGQFLAAPGHDDLACLLLDHHMQMVHGPRGEQEALFDHPPPQGACQPGNRRRQERHGHLPKEH